MKTKTTHLKIGFMKKISALALVLSVDAGLSFV
jgi:hypothetical protein